MDRFVTAEDISTAWVLALDQVQARRKHAVTHLVVRISHPPTEGAKIRALADSLLASARLQEIDTVRNTIFPFAYAQRFPEPADLAQYYREQYPTIKRVTRKNRRGTYFGRLVAYPFGTTELDQLTPLVQKLRAQRDGGHKSSMYEVNIWKPGDLPTGTGFPCMSFMSFHMTDNELHLTAHYRNQYLIERAYGNYLGLAQLLQYVAAAVQLDVGELLVIAGHAALDTRSGASMADVRQLIHDARLGIRV